jgi:hypothetical protein
MADHPARAGVHTDMINRGWPVPMVAPGDISSAIRLDPQPFENMNADDAALSAAEDTRGKPRSSRTHPGDLSSKSRFRRGTSGEELYAGRKAGKIRAQFYPSPVRAF